MNWRIRDFVFWCHEQVIRDEANHNIRHFLPFFCSGGSRAAKIASSKTFFRPFCKAKKIVWICIEYCRPGIYRLKKIRNFSETKIQNRKTLPKLNWHYSKFGPYHIYDFIHIIQFLIPILSLISKMIRKMWLFSLFFWNRAKTLPFSVKIRNYANYLVWA